MMDQQSKFTSKGISAEFVGEAQQNKAVIKRVLRGDVQLVYITPESIIENPVFRNMLMTPCYQEKLIALIVDEAHCIQLWGEQFRKAFFVIGNLRSLVPSGVNVMALTATATLETFHVVKRQLSMSEDVVLVTLPPEKSNIRYCMRPEINLEELGECLHEEMMDKEHVFPKTLLFVRKYKDCSDVYAMLKQRLGSGLTNPPGYPDLSKYRRIDMYSRVMTIGKKNQVLSSFMSEDSPLQLVIATSAFGLGIDCPDIRRVIHWGVPNTVEEYIQETGRAGRNNAKAESIIYDCKIGKTVTPKMKDYMSNQKKCRRKFLFQWFLCFYENDVEVVGCDCCDVCAKKCSCDKCKS